MPDDLLSVYGTGRNGHSHFAPSAAAMWLTCAGSLIANVAAGDNAGYDAAYGTVAHSVAEAWNSTGKRPTHMIGLTLSAQAGGRDWKVVVDENMLFHVGRFVDWCRELPGDHYFEQRVDLSELMPIPGQGGTADHFACEVGRLTITDLKMGTGVRVYAERNPQAMLYAAGVFMEWDWIYRFETISIRICQPRLDIFEVYECSRQELLDFMEFVKVRARLAWNSEAPRSPSPKACRFCAVNHTCPSRAMELADFVDDALADECEPDPEVFKEYSYEANIKSPDAVKRLAEAEARLRAKPLPALNLRQRAFLLTRRKHFEQLFKAIAESLLEEAEKGVPVPFFTLGKGRVSRHWKDPEIATGFVEKMFSVSRDEICPPTMLSVNQAEKLLVTKTGMTAAKVKTVLREIVDEYAGKRSLKPDKEAYPEIDDIPEELDEETEG
jgi:hypothetical protein